MTKTQWCFEEPIEEKGRQGFWTVDDNRLPEKIVKLFRQTSLPLAMEDDV